MGWDIVMGWDGMYPRDCQFHEEEEVHEGDDQDILKEKRKVGLLYRVTRFVKATVI